MKVLRQLKDDGLESLGTLALPAAVVIGDPAALGSPAGSGRWFGGAISPGQWWMFGRPWAHDADYLEELVLVHESALAGFYEQYDELVSVATLPLPRRRCVVVPASSQRDAAVLRSLTEPEELPWVMDDRAVAVAGIGELPAQLAASPRSPVTMLSVGLDRAPASAVPTAPFTAEEKVAEEKDAED